MRPWHKYAYSTRYEGEGCECDDVGGRSTTLSLKPACDVVCSDSSRLSHLISPFERDFPPREQIADKIIGLSYLIPCLDFAERLYAF